MRLPLKDSTDYYWGGRNASYASEDQKIWFEKMLEKNGLFLIGIRKMEGEV